MKSKNKFHKRIQKCTTKIVLPTLANFWNCLYACFNPSRVTFSKEFMKKAKMWENSLLSYLNVIKYNTLKRFKQLSEAF